MSNHNELSLAVLDEAGNVVKTVLEDNGLGGFLDLSLLLESHYLLLFWLVIVFGEQFLRS